MASKVVASELKPEERKRRRDHFAKWDKRMYRTVVVGMISLVVGAVLVVIMPSPVSSGVLLLGGVLMIVAFAIGPHCANQAKLYK